MKIRGRPRKSLIRDRMQTIVDALGVTYGYEIYKVYQDTYTSVDLRSMYYHLKKGSELDEFEEVGVQEVKGDFTWGDVSMRKCYILGPNATQRADDGLHIVIKTLGLNYQDPNNFIDWSVFAEKKLEEFQHTFNKIKNKKNAKKDLEFLNKRLNSICIWLEDKTNIKELKGLKKKVVEKIKV